MVNKKSTSLSSTKSFLTVFMNWRNSAKTPTTTSPPINAKSSILKQTSTCTLKNWLKSTTKPSVKPKSPIKSSTSRTSGTLSSRTAKTKLTSNSEGKSSEQKLSRNKFWHIPINFSWAKTPNWKNKKERNWSWTRQKRTSTSLWMLQKKEKCQSSKVPRPMKSPNSWNPFDRYLNTRTLKER